MSSCAECPGHLLYDKFPVVGKDIADGWRPRIGFAGIGIEDEALRNIVDVVPMSQDEPLGLVGKGLHLGDDVGADMSRNLLEHHEPLSVPSVTSDCVSLTYERKYLLEGESVWATTHAAFNSRLAQR